MSQKFQSLDIIELKKSNWVFQKSAVKSKMLNKIKKEFTMNKLSYKTIQCICDIQIMKLLDETFGNLSVPKSVTRKKVIDLKLHYFQHFQYFTSLTR